MTQPAPPAPPDTWRTRRRLRSAARWAPPLRTPARRRAAWRNMMLADHGFLRSLYLNLHAVGPGRPPRAWRSAQPSPRQIARLARRGLRTVISLRGGVTFGSYPLELEACARHGIAFEKLVLRSRDLPTRAELAEVDALTARVAAPVLFHCKAGADRAGLMAALWLILREGRPAGEAAGQLSLRYGHFALGPTGILDHFLARAAEAEGRGLSFRDWVATEYDRDALIAEFRRSGRGGGVFAWITDRLLRRE